MNSPQRNIEIFGVYGRGVPNKERIILRAYAPLDLKNYALILGYELPGDTVLPYPDNFLWLGPSVVEIPSWIFVYTGSGRNGLTQEVNTKDPVHNIYWNKDEVLLSDHRVLPTLIRINAEHIGNVGETPVQRLQKNLELPGMEELTKALARIASAEKNES